MVTLWLVKHQFVVVFMLRFSCSFPSSCFRVSHLHLCALAPSPSALEGWGGRLRETQNQERSQDELGAEEVGEAYEDVLMTTPFRCGCHQRLSTTPPAQRLTTRSPSLKPFLCLLCGSRLFLQSREGKGPTKGVLKIAAFASYLSDTFAWKYGTSNCASSPVCQTTALCKPAEGRG